MFSIYIGVNCYPSFGKDRNDQEKQKRVCDRDKRK